MSVAKKEYKRVTVKSLIEMKKNGEKISMLTAYDYSMAKIVDAANVDVILVGDSASNVKRILNAGIPVMGHLGLTPQSIYKFGTYTVRAKEEEEAEKLKSDALMLEKAGCFAIVLEKIPATLAREVAESVTIPVIGIGAGNGVDGQVLVVHDLVGLTQEFNPRFLRRYMNLYEEMGKAISDYVSDVKSRDFPSDEEQY